MPSVPSDTMDGRTGCISDGASDVADKHSTYFDSCSSTVTRGVSAAVATCQHATTCKRRGHRTLTSRSPRGFSGAPPLEMPALRDT
jgi:hypothetical protein